MLVASSTASDHWTNMLVGDVGTSPRTTGAGVAVGADVDVAVGIGVAVAVGVGVGVAVGVGVGVTVGVGVGVAVGVGVGVALDVSVGVAVGIGVAVAVGIGLGVAVGIGVGVVVGVGVGVAVGVGVGVAVGVGVGVGVTVSVRVGVAVGVGVGVAVGVGVGVAVGVGVGVAVGVGVGMSVGGGVGVRVTVAPSPSESLSHPASSHARSMTTTLTANHRVTWPTSRPTLRAPPRCTSPYHQRKLVETSTTEDETCPTRREPITTSGKKVAVGPRGVSRAGNSAPRTLLHRGVQAYGLPWTTQRPDASAPRRRRPIDCNIRSPLPSARGVVKGVSRHPWLSSQLSVPSSGPRTC